MLKILEAMFDGFYIFEYILRNLKVQILPKSIVTKLQYWSYDLAMQEIITTC